jgi:hypothetical protein
MMTTTRKYSECTRTLVADNRWRIATREWTGIYRLVGISGTQGKLRLVRGVAEQPPKILYLVEEDA